MSPKTGLEDLESADPKKRYACAKALVRTAHTDPARLYPHRERFMDLLHGENQILAWTAVDVLAGLSHIDDEERLGQLIDELGGLLLGGRLISANHAAAALADIGRAHRELAPRITNLLLQVEGQSYETDECRNIVIGKAILGLGYYIDPEAADRSVIDFVERQTKNSRSATRKKAEHLLKKLPAA